jgi:hypothetical protein
MGASWRSCSDHFKTSSADRNWKLVGEAYVHSFMHGEAVRGGDDVELERVYLE